MDTLAIRQAPGYFETGFGPPVLLLHGSLGSKGQWRALTERLAPRFRCIAVDLHGYGDNPLPLFRPRHSFEHEVALVLRRLGEAGGVSGPMHVVGHSFGAGVALALARRHPERVASLALYEPPCFPLLEKRFPAAYLYTRAIGHRVRAATIDGEPAEALERFLDYWGGKGSFDALQPAAREAMLGRVAKTALDFDAVFSAPADPLAWSRVDVPTLLLRGSRSPLEVRAAVEILSQALPRARLDDLEGDHLMPVRDPQPVNAAIEGFLAP